MNKSFVSLLLFIMPVWVCAQWLPAEYIPYGVNKFNSVWFADDQVGFVVGDAGEILRSADGGKNWQQKISGINTNLYDVCFPAPSTGWAVGGEGMMAGTTDGGVTWQQQNVGTVSDLLSVTFGDPASGFVCGDQGTLLRNLTGGTQWDLLSFGNLGKYVHIQFVSPATGFSLRASGIQPNGTLLRTTNGANTWQEIQSIPGVTSFHFTGNQYGFASFTTEIGPTADTRFYSSADGGLTWTMENPDCPDFLEIFFVNDSTGYGITYTGIHKTTDKGKTWKNQLPGGSQMFTGIYFLDPYLGFAVGYDGKIFRTTNGGELAIGDPQTDTGIRMSVFPNPFGDFTAISCGIPARSRLKLVILNAMGVELFQVADQEVTPGDCIFRIDGSALSPGVYYCSLIAGSGNLVRKMIKL